MTEFRPYQTSLIDDIYSAWRGGARNVLAQLPTGGGKAVIARGIVAHHNGASLMMAHRQELVSQLSLHLAREAVPHRIIAPKGVVANIVKIHREAVGKSFMSPTAANVVASVQTLASRGDDHEWQKQISLVIPDEAHHYLKAGTFGAAASMFPNARMVGFTATPQRADGRGLGSHADGIFDSMVVGPSMRELINQGHLSEYEIVMPRTSFDREHLTIGSTGDFTAKSLRDESERAQIVGDVVSNYLMWAMGSLCVVFAASVDAAEKIAAQFNACGVPAASISAKNDDYERFGIMRRFEARQLHVLCNCDLLGEGVDVPAIETVIMARATQSLAVFLQQIGRALRPAPGKSRALIIDHVSNVREHGLPDRPRRWSLDATVNKREKDPDEIPITQCDNCMRAYERIHKSCPHCGHERIPAIYEGRRTIEQVEGELILLDAATLAEMRAAVDLEAPGSVAARVGMVAGENAAKRAARLQIERIASQTTLANVIAIWAGKQRALGRADDESYRRFWHWTGHDVLTALSLSRADMDALAARIMKDET
jgi:superfamily II DNA or RNA helicase